MGVSVLQFLNKIPLDVMDMVVLMINEYLDQQNNYIHHYFNVYPHSVTFYAKSFLSIFYLVT